MPNPEATQQSSGRWRNALLVLSLLVVCVAADQLTKQAAVRMLRDAEPQSLFGDCLRLQYALNSGGFLSLGSNLSQGARFGLFVGFNLLLMCGLGWFLVRSSGERRGLSIGVALLFAGGVGNLIDRLTLNGQVIDFLNVGIGSIRTGIFNVADMAIMAGAILMACYGWAQRAPAEEPALQVAKSAETSS